MWNQFNEIEIGNKVCIIKNNGEWNIGNVTEVIEHNNKKYVKLDVFIRYIKINDKIIENKERIIIVFTINTFENVFILDPNPFASESQRRYLLNY